MALQNDLTSGSVRSQILRFAFPLIFSNLFQALYNAVDMIFVGQYTGPAGLSAVSVSGPIMNIMFMTVSGLSVGVTVVIANHCQIMKLATQKLQQQLLMIVYILIFINN